jgi:hypothetical protein
MKRSQNQVSRAVVETLETRNYPSSAAIDAETVAIRQGLDRWWMDWQMGAAIPHVEASAQTNSTPPASTPVSSSTPPASTVPVSTPVQAPNSSVGSNSTSVVLPALAAVAAPSSNPPLPSGMNQFTPTFESQSPNSGAPVIATASVVGGSGQSIALTGTGLGSGTQFLVYGQTGSSDGTLTYATVQDVTANGVTITISSSEPANAMYLVWAVNSEGASAPVAVNQTQAWWIGTPEETLDTSSNDTVGSYSGATMSVYGTNLSNGAATPESWVYLQPTDGSAGVWASVTSVNPYQVSFTLPTVSTTTTYNVWVNNGLGGSYGWSEVMRNGSPQVLSVAPAASTWSNNSADLFNVVNYGADPTGTSDSGAAIQAAINAIEAANAANPANYTYTLYFPNGTFLVSGGENFVIPSYIRILGQSESGTILSFQGAATSAQIAVRLQSCDDIDNITIEHSGATSTAAYGGNALVQGYQANNIIVNDVTILSNEVGLSFYNSQGFTVENSSIEDGIGGVWNSDEFFNNDTILEAYDLEEAITLDGTHDVSFTNSTIENYDNSDPTTDGSGQSRFIEYNTDFGDIYNQYIADNTTLLGQVDPGNSGEQILQEGTSLSWSGTIASATSNTFTIVVPHGSDPSLTNDEVMVSGGPGLAQLQTVTGQTVTYDAATDTDSITCTVNGTWTVLPTSASSIAVGYFLSQAVIYQNTFQDEIGTMGANAHAATGVSIGGYELFVDGNTMSNLQCCGININDSALDSTTGVDSPSYYVNVINNQVLHTADNDTDYAVASGGISVDGSTPYTDFVGLEIRDNTISSIPVGINLQGNGDDPDTLSVVEQNNITAASGIVIFNDPDTLLNDNTINYFATNSRASTAYLLYGSSPAALMVDNTLNGFNADDEFGLATTNAIDSTTDLAIPLDMMGLSNVSWAAGSTALNWITFQSSSGTNTSGSSNPEPVLVINSADGNGLSYNETVNTSATFTYTNASGTQVTLTIPVSALLYNG